MTKSVLINLNTGTVEEVLPIIAKLHDEGLGYGIGPAIVCQEAEQIIRELYGALRVCVNVCPKPLQKPLNLNGHSPYDIAMAALAKARGER